MRGLTPSGMKIRHDILPQSAINLTDRVGIWTAAMQCYLRYIVAKNNNMTRHPYKPDGRITSQQSGDVQLGISSLTRWFRTLVQYSYIHDI